MAVFKTPLEKERAPLHVHRLPSPLPPPVCAAPPGAHLHRLGDGGESRHPPQSPCTARLRALTPRRRDRRGRREHTHTPSPLSPLCACDAMRCVRGNEALKLHQPGLGGGGADGAGALESRGGDARIPARGSTFRTGLAENGERGSPFLGTGQVDFSHWAAGWLAERLRGLTHTERRDHAISREITRDHARSHEITRDHAR